MAGGERAARGRGGGGVLSAAGGAAGAPLRVVYLCWPNGWSLHNVGLGLAAGLAPRGIRVDVVDSRAWFERPTAADVALLSHLSFYWPGFPYRDHVRALVGVVHDPDEVSTFRDRLGWLGEPMHPLPQLAAFERVVSCSREMVAVLRERYGAPALHAPTFPHNAAAIAAAAAARERPNGALVRFLSTAYGPGHEPWRRVLARARHPGFWSTDERGRFSARQLRSALVRVHRKNVPWLERLRRALAADARAAVDFRFGRAHAQLDAGAYLARLAGGDVYVCTSFMEGGPLPVMEAVLAGLAVITTPVGQTAEWVTHGENGFVCRTYADVERAAREYIADGALLRAHQARSLEIARSKRFDADAWERVMRG